MVTANWNDVWALAEKVMARESPFLQITIALGAAFSALMIVEGLRATFVPRSERVQPIQPIAPPRAPAAEPPPTRSQLLPEKAPTAAYRSARRGRPVTPPQFEIARYAPRRERVLSKLTPLRPKIRRGTLLLSDQSADADSVAAAAVEQNTIQLNRDERTGALRAVSFDA
jgi:hypothetical protein